MPLEELEPARRSLVADRREWSTSAGARPGPRVASCSLGATTPTKSPSRTTLTPGIAAARVCRARRDEHRTTGGRRTLPRSIPGRSMSLEYWCRPVTNAQAVDLGNRLAGDLPFGRQAWSSCRRRWSRRASGPWSARRSRATCPVAAMRHLAAGGLERAASTPHSLAARSSRSPRAAAAARRICGTMVGVVRLPKVPMSKGT